MFGDKKVTGPLNYLAPAMLHQLARWWFHSDFFLGNFHLETWGSVSGHEKTISKKVTEKRRIAKEGIRCLGEKHPQGRKSLVVTEIELIPSKPYL